MWGRVAVVGEAKSTRHPRSGPNDWRSESWASDPSNLESQVVGFTPNVAEMLFREILRSPASHASFETGLSAAVAQFKSTDQERRICWLPRMPIDPTREGSSGVERSFL